MASNTATTPRHSNRPVAKPPVAITAMLAFISCWRAPAIVLNDLASPAYYAGGKDEQFIGKTALVHPGHNASLLCRLSALRRKLQQVCPRRRLSRSQGGDGRDAGEVPRIGTDVRLRLTGPISGVSAGLYLAGFINELLAHAHIHMIVALNLAAEAFAVLATLYFWWENVKSITETSEKALSISQAGSCVGLFFIKQCASTPPTKAWDVKRLIKRGMFPKDIASGKAGAPKNERAQNRSGRDDKNRDRSRLTVPVAGFGFVSPLY